MVSAASVQSMSLPDNGPIHHTEASLSQTEAVQAQLARDAEALQAQIDSLREELQKHQDPQKMQLIQEMISVCTGSYSRSLPSISEHTCLQDLMSQMSRIREQATESEAVVRNITKDIQLLDLAKKNLTSSMTYLKRLQMLGEC